MATAWTLSAVVLGLVDTPTSLTPEFGLANAPGVALAAVIGAVIARTTQRDHRSEAGMR